MTRRIAMWSGPRNISTALLRAWGNRPDTCVSDEPLYAYYLRATARTDHPGYEEIVRYHETDWRMVVDWLLGPVPEGKAVFYQKHMAHHVLPELPLHWIGELTNCFLIRDPREVLGSLAKFLPSPTVDDTGLPDLVRLFDHVRATSGTIPPVIDARDVLGDPRGMLESLCRRLKVPFCEQMLHWSTGPRTTDGVWGRYWYANVYRSTGFEKYRPRRDELPAELQPLLEQCRPLYERLYAWRLQPASRSAMTAGG